MKVKALVERYILPTVAAVTVRSVLRTATGLVAAGAVASGTGLFSDSSGPAQTFGVDFGWGGPSVPAMQQAGAKFGASYLSSDPSKNWQVQQIQDYHAGGVATVAVFETSGTRALDGCAAGAADAQSAASQLAADGAPAGQPFTMAIDFDASGPDVLPYFLCASRAEPGRVNAYGGAGPIVYLYNQHVVGNLNWCTYAWLYRNGGSFPPASICPLEQYSNDHVIGGRSVDFDRAVAPSYGQWGVDVSPPAPPPPSPSTLASWQRALNSSYAVYRWRQCPVGTDTSHGCNVFAQRVTWFQAHLWSAQPKSRWHCWGPNARSQTPVCGIARPEVYHWSAARDATAHAYDRNGCNGPATFPQPVNSPVCKILRHRQSWFQNRIDGAMTTF